jgi:3'-phosphoadenosine 5'-phosphosulfate sulfotransferase (PAPS reductase)/FAD synthetase
VTPAERAGFLAHARLPTFARRIKQAQSVLETALGLGAAYVANSWGKDSLVLLHLVQQQQPSIPALFFADPDEEALDNYAEMAATYCARFPHTTYERLCFEGDRVPDKVASAALWQSYPVALVGIRAEESAGRRTARKVQGLIHRYTAGPHAGSWRAWPLADWTWRDVWAYVVAHDLPMLASYEHPANADRSRSRTCNLLAKEIAYGPKGAQFGRISQLKERCPAYFNHLAEFYPEIARLA